MFSIVIPPCCSWFPFLIRKLVVLCGFPFGLSVLLLTAGLLTRRRWLSTAGLVLLVSASMPWTAGRLSRGLESRFPAMAVADCPAADAVVVLGGIVGRGMADKNDFEWGESVDRFEMAVKLMKAGKAPLLVFTGARTPWSASPENEGERLRRAAIEHGVDAGGILVTPLVSTTAEEASVVSGLARQRGWRRCVLVTSAMHMPRAALLFERAGLNVSPFPVDFRNVPGEERSNATGMVPQAAALNGTEAALKEWLAMAYYRFTSH